MKIIQITDTHINADPSTRIFGLVNTDATLLDVLQKVKNEKPDYVIATGDLSQDGSVESYQRLNTYLNTLDCDVYAICGNHDNHLNFDQYLIGGNVHHTRVLVTPLETFIFLNSLKPGFDSGYISDDELVHLEATLREHQHCIPVIHHHFMPLGFAIDKYMLENSAKLLDILMKYKQRIKFCVTGHVHGYYETIEEGITSYSSISTCIQFAKSNTFMFENKKPGYTVYDLSDTCYEVYEKTI